MTARGEAGPRGEDVRSDLHVSVAVRKTGGREVQVASRVNAYYGRSIDRVTRRVLDAFGVGHAQVVLDDKGALPFVIAARVETALRRAGATRKKDPRPKQAVKATGPTERDRLRRSRLYLPGNEPKFFVNAGLHHPDGVILDLEDSVHADEKDAARLIVRNALRAVDFHGAELMVRINQLPLGLEDLDAVVPESPHLILLPKTEHADQVRRVHKRVLAIQKRAGIDQAIWIMPILESALGVEHAYEIATAADTVVAITVGLEDYTADLGVVKTSAGDESLYARMRVVNAAKAAGIQASDSVYSDVGDVDGLKARGVKSRGMGFDGMGCIHPRQIEPIHEAFAPSQGDVDKALAIVAAFEEAEARGLGVVSLGTKMIDAPVVKRAVRLVGQARRAGLIPGNGGSDG